MVAIRAFDNNGFTSNYTLMRGIDHAIEKGARVLSLSWGSETSSSLCWNQPPAMPPQRG
jgi:thermitase